VWMYFPTRKKIPISGVYSNNLLKSIKRESV
jgi:hypothetical protein